MPNSIVTGDFEWPCLQWLESKIDCTTAPMEARSIGDSWRSCCDWLLNSLRALPSVPELRRWTSSWIDWLIVVFLRYSSPSA